MKISFAPFQGQLVKSNTLGYDNATLCDKAYSVVKYNNFLVCGSQVHSNLAQVSALTLPDSLNSALGRTSPVLSLSLIGGNSSLRVLTLSNGLGGKRHLPSPPELGYNDAQKGSTSNELARGISKEVHHS